MNLKELTAALSEAQQGATALGFDASLLALHREWLGRCLERNDGLDALCMLNQWMGGFIDKPLGHDGQEAVCRGDRKTAFWGRKQHGSYYTPSDIVDFVVETAVLEPMALRYRQALSQNSAQIPNPSRWLKLKVIDPAMGGGVFLLKTLEAIASAFEAEFETWLARRGGDKALAWREVMADLNISEDIKAECHAWDSRHLRAFIVAQCLYGIDINPLALRVVDQSLEALTGVEAQLWAKHFVLANAIAPAQAESLCGDPLMAEQGHAAYAYARFFPEVFERPTPGFDFVLLNPPWNKLVLNKREFFSTFVVDNCLKGDANSRAQRIAALRKKPEIESKWQAFSKNFEQTREDIHRASRFYAHRSQSAGPRGHSDVYAFFLDLAYQIAREGGIIAAVLPNAFYANAGASVVRKYMLNVCAPAYLFGLNNAKEIFPDVSKALRFCLLKTEKRALSEDLRRKLSLPHDRSVSMADLGLEHSRLAVLNGEPTEGVACVFPSRRLGNSSEGETSPTICAFALNQRHESIEQVDGGGDLRLGFGFSGVAELRAAMAERGVVVTTAERAFGLAGGIVAEVSSLEDFECLARLRQSMTFGDFMDGAGINLSQELNSTVHAPFFVSAQKHSPSGDARLEPQLSALRGRGFLPVYEKGSLAFYTPNLRDNVRYLFDMRAYLEAGKSARRLKGHEGFRIACRSTIHASESEKLVFSLLAPGALVTNSALVEMHIEKRCIEDALLLMAVANTSCLNAVAQKYIGTNMKRFLLRTFPFPRLDARQKSELAMMALRLAAIDERYFPLLEQFAQPFLNSAAERRRLNLEIEAMVREGLCL